MKKIITIFAILASTMAFSQVGIGTNTPSSKSILDLTATDKGLLLPRMTTAERTAIAPTATTDKSMQVFDTTTNTIWFWNGTVWVEQGAKNIYDSNGDVSPTATANRTVTFTNGGSLNFDTNSLFVDATNNRVGIGTNTPQSRLNIVNDNQGNGSSDDFIIESYNATGAQPLILFNLFSSRGTKAAPINLNNNDLLGEIAFGGRWNNTDNISVFTSRIRGFYRGNGTTNLNSLSFDTSGTERMVIGANGNVGIGTNNPLSFLHINRTGNPSAIASIFVDGITLTANTTGPAGGLTGPGFYFESLNGTVGQRLMKVNYTLNGSNEAFINYQAVSDNGNASVRDVMAIFHNGRVGIGTTNPSERLHINGDGINPPFQISNQINQPSTGSFGYLTIDNSTGKVYRGTQATQAFVYQKYTFTNVDRDWINNFNTLINSNDYTLVIVGTSFDSELTVVDSDNAFDKFRSQNVFAFIDSGTWRLTADFPSVATTANVNGAWTIYTLIIRNNQVQTNSDLNFNLGGSANGSALVTPVN